MKTIVFVLIFSYSKARDVLVIVCEIIGNSDIGFDEIAGQVRLCTEFQSFQAYSRAAALQLRL